MANPDYQSIGALSPDAEQTLTHQAAWDGIAAEAPQPENPIQQRQDTDFSRWNDRANRQRLANDDEGNYAQDFLQNDGTADNEPVAGYGALPWGQQPTAATNPGHPLGPFPQAPDGTISGADAASEQSGNTGTQN